MRGPSARTRGGRYSTPASSFERAAISVERVNPLFPFHAAVSRQDDNNWPPGGWFPEQRMTREEALKSMTIWPAFAGFQEQLTGSLTPGKYADFVILDQDIMTIPETSILGTGVVATYIGGKAVFERRR
jgi:predicted amidohydrolase YtcJ